VKRFYFLAFIAAAFRFALTGGTSELASR